ETRTHQGVVINSPLLIGADGRHSRVRECAEIGVTRRDYDQSAITCLINHSDSHNDVSTEFHRPAGPLALVPLPGNQSTVVWVESRARAEEIMGLNEQGFVAALQAQTHDILGAITLEAGPQSYPLCAMKAKALTAPRIALVAEAAHAMSPITAQGLNLSLRDVAALAEEITDAARVGQDIGSKTVLGRYESRRRFDVGTRSLGVDAINRIVSHDIAPLKALRRGALKTLTRIAPLKSAAMRIGLAPAFDAGRLARGEAL
ncbi:MAG: FAD-dependent monooxygenase, partial [Bdellovibrionales bacterium]